MGTMKRVEDLKAWQVGMDLVVEIYRITKKFPKEELYGLVSQLRRSSVSVPTNTAEGFSRFTYADKANKYTIARGECGEVITLLRISIRVGILKAEEAQKGLELANETGRLLSGLIKACKNQNAQEPKSLIF